MMSEIALYLSEIQEMGGDELAEEWESAEGWQREAADLELRRRAQGIPQECGAMCFIPHPP